jgi:hypothetical protein
MTTDQDQRLPADSNPSAARFWTCKDDVDDRRAAERHLDPTHDPLLSRKLFFDPPPTKQSHLQRIEAAVAKYSGRIRYIMSRLVESILAQWAAIAAST